MRSPDRPIRSQSLHRLHYPGRHAVTTSSLNNQSMKLSLILLTWRIWWAPNNTSKWQMSLVHGVVSQPFSTTFTEIFPQPPPIVLPLKQRLRAHPAQKSWVICINNTCSWTEVVTWHTQDLLALGHTGEQTLSHLLAGFSCCKENIVLVCGTQGRSIEVPHILEKKTSRSALRSLVRKKTYSSRSKVSARRLWTRTVYWDLGTTHTPVMSG